MSDYKPISCEFHEVLESLAMTHKNADVEYLNTDGELRMINGVIRDVYARGGVSVNGHICLTIISASLSERPKTRAFSSAAAGCVRQRESAPPSLPGQFSAYKSCKSPPRAAAR